VSTPCTNGSASGLIVATRIAESLSHV
jgi:hypothetical protein